MEGELDLSRVDLASLFGSKGPKKKEGTKGGKRESPALEVDVLAPFASLIQGKLKDQGIASLVAGGLATDLLARQALPEHACRPHKDIDLLVSRNQLRSIDDVMEGLGLKEVSGEAGQPDILTEPANLRTFEGKNGTRIDVMGYYSTPRKGVGDFPLMSWGKIDRHRQPIEVKLSPVRVEHKGRSLDVLDPKSLFEMKSAQNVKFDRDDMAIEDLKLLRSLVDNGK